jgi:AraC family transcriptional regulator of adaptative response/methylated-DNA-[protein]-cysteine methyltransferase
MSFPITGTADGERIRYATGRCWLGAILVALSDRGVCAILPGDDADSLVQELAARFPHARLEGNDPAACERLADAVHLVEDPSQPTTIPLDLRGTPFQQRVWQELQQIPAGATASYGDVARRMGAPGMAREVAEACAANDLAVAVPCHRVIRTGGGISGYRWGVKRKRALLARESRGAQLDPSRPPVYSAAARRAVAGR